MATLTTNILSLNLSVITAVGNLHELRSLLNREYVDIVLLQEVAIPAFDFYGYSECVNLGPDKRGTALLWKSALPISDVCSLPSGRAIAATFGDVRIVCVYAPSGTSGAQERRAFFAQDLALLFAEGAQKCLDELYAKRTLTAEDHEEIRELRDKIGDLLRAGMSKVCENDKSSTPCGGEEPSMYTVISAKKKRESRTITRLEGEDGGVHTTQQAISTAIVTEFSSKFSAPVTPLDLDCPILEDIQDCLSPQDRQALAADVTAEELLHALKKSPRNKSPGSDGLPAEFYTVTWDVIGTTVLQVVNTVLQRGRLCRSMLVGIMVLLPKVAKPATIKHYRPLTMLNTDYKLIARVIAVRMTAVVSKAVHPMVVQPGGVRNITASLCDLRDVVATVEGETVASLGASPHADPCDRNCHYLAGSGQTTESVRRNYGWGSPSSAATVSPSTVVVAYHDLLDEPGCLVSADIEGAFNNVRHDYLYAVLMRMGFGADFVDIMRTVYTGRSTRVQVNGYLSKRFAVERSVRQGCPLSMVAFILAISPLIDALYARLGGVHARDAHFVATAYADDVTVLVREEQDVLRLRQALAEFKEVSGLAVNEQKTVAIALGTWNTERHPLPYRYVESARILGVIFAKDVTTMSSRTWATVTGAAIGILGQHTHRKLNIVQRVWFAQTYCLSKLWYVAQVLPVPDGVVTALSKAVGDFVWRGSFFRVPFRNLCSPRTEGGLGLLHPKWKSQALFMGRWMSTVLQDTDSFASVWLQVLTERWPPNDPGAGPHIPDSLPHYKAYHRCRPTVPLLLDEPVDARVVHRGLYDQLVAADPPPPPRAHRLTDRRVDWTATWRHISRSWHGSATRSAWYLAVNHLISTNDRLHRCRPTVPALCARCGARDTLGHRLVSCGAAADVWAWLNVHVVRLGTADAYLRPDRVWKPAQFNNTMQWLLGKIVRYLLEEDIVNVSVQNVKEFLAEARKSISVAQATKHFGDHIKRLPL
ncbi:LOW QUALITY PROTEIN: LINE-1 retrotransposable element ORF2 protein [Frankliniella fusca]|uniref:LINE-1 retrotransposable element ORF2 protein n=1 Tax=Frankliniella fusca TaxID=407009 RepID=A0AAE1LK97_9NEOP|nr:LOW QUALITY PROTEIN: LINE-1 retrotransposable element ORF2 protein [Frankliniella fusca]